MSHENQLRIGIDARLCGKKHAGIGRYIENLLLRLPLIATDIHWIYFFHDKSQLADLIAGLSGVELPVGMTAKSFFANLEIIYIPLKHYSLAEQIKLPKIFRQANLDLLHVPHFNIPLFYQGKIITTIHDLLWHEKKGLNVTTLNPFVYYLKYFFYLILVKKTVYKSQRIIVPTQTIAATIEKYYPHQIKLNKKALKNNNSNQLLNNYKNTKIIITPEGFYQTKAIKISRKVQQQLPDAPFLLYVGSLYPHKNIEIVFKVMNDALQKSELNYHLVIVGARNIFMEQTQKKVTDYHLNKYVHFLGYVEDAQLANLYQQSLALIQPSLSEGFGLTGLEAFAQGAPVIASDIPIFHEVYDQAALYFNPHTGNQLKEQITQLQLSPSIRLQMIDLGHKQASLYNWDKMTMQTLNAYQLIVCSCEL